MRGKKEALLLGIESSGLACSVGLGQGGEFLGQISLLEKHIHSRKLAPFVETLLQQAGKSANDLQGIVLSMGPGSFTGLRIGFSLAKGMAHALEIPLVGIPTLEVWAYQMGPAYQPILSVMDAHRGEWFVALYRWEGANLTELLPPQRTALSKLPDLIGGQSPWVSGPHALLLKKEIEAQNPRLKFPAFLPPEPAQWALLSLGWQRFQRGSFLDLNSSEPLYLRSFKGAT